MRKDPMSDYSSYKFLKVTKRNAILEVILNRPEVRNAFNRGMHEEWARVLDQAEDDPDIKVLTLRGAGKIFSAGGDLKEGAPGYIVDGVRPGRHHDIPHLPRVWYFRKAIVAAVHGFAGPSGCELLGCCDFVIAAENTKFSFEILKMGGEGSTSPIMSLFLSLRTMKRLYLMGCWFDEKRALEWEFVQRVVPLERLDDELNRWAEELCKIPSVQIKAAKDTLHRIYELRGLTNIIGVGNRGSGHGSEEDREFYELVLQKGMKEALKFRDAQFDQSLSKI
jgi:enoyl-CoA hydratase/carnithine racemase